MNFFFRFLLLILFLILIYIIYKSEIYWQGKNRSYYLIYYTGILLTTISVIIFNYLNIKIKKYIIIIFISFFFSFYLFEGILVSYKIKKLNLHIESITKLYEDLKKVNSNITFATFPNNFLQSNSENLFILAGKSKIKTIFCSENGYYSIYDSDRYGFNNPDKEWDSKEIEYVLIGDSFTHGACVNRPNDIASVLRLYSKKSVLNLGMGGNGPLIEYATLREYLDSRAKNVLWLFYEGNDLSNLKGELKNNILNKYLNNQTFKQNLKIKQTEIDHILTIYIEKEKKSVTEKKRQGVLIGEFIKLFNTRSLLFKEKFVSIPPELKLILKLTKNLVKNHNGKLYFVYLPEFYRYKNPNFYEINDLKNQIKKIVDDLGIEFIDIDEEVFKKEKNFLKLFPSNEGGHYNIEGYKKVAIKIYEKTKYNK